ncbi:acyl carrier protein [Marimonas sp. MJW-29]|uniref:Acyl carrier protein n=1 Tax=Sulfitobacter sediminis TaxID=3234186 RepID=A0ABV3RPT0_9RHOB
MTETTKAKQLLADALGLAPSEIGQDTSFESCNSWDSLAHFRVVAAIEEILGRQLSPTEIFEMADFASIETLLAEGDLDGTTGM